MHPPTAYCFAKHLLFLLPYTSITMDVRHDIIELARFVTELSVIDYFFVIHRQSSVGLAALLFAVDELPTVSESVRTDFVKELGKITKLDLESPELQDCLERIRLLYAQGGYARMASATETRADTVSPVCVSYGVVPAHISSPPNATTPTATYESEDATKTTMS
jgi:Cyclin, C-terminal domain